MAITISGRSVSDVKPDITRIQSNAIIDNNNFVSGVERTMRQISAPLWEYAFSISPGQVNQEGYGVSFNEIERPYSTPIVDIVGGKSLRASFEFPIVPRSSANKEIFDGFFTSVDNEILLLQEFANYAVPVQFNNMHKALTTPTWYIDNVSFNHSRLTTIGENSQAICTMSLIEFKTRNKRLILLPRFSYGKLPAKEKKDGEDIKPPGKDAVEDALKQLRLAEIEATKRAATTGAKTGRLDPFDVFKP